MEWTDEGVTTSVRLFAAPSVHPLGSSALATALRAFAGKGQTRSRQIEDGADQTIRRWHTVAHSTGRARHRTAKDVQLRMAALLRLAATPYA